LCAEKSFQEIKSDIKACNLFIFQNCLNELENTSTIQENIKFLFDNAPLKSIVIIADLLYDQNSDIVEDIKKKIHERSDSEVLQEGSLKIRSSLPISPIIQTNLLTGEDGLIPRSRINFMFLAMRKDDQISSYFDDIPF